MPGHPAGTIRQVRGRGKTQTLEVQPAAGPANAPPLEIPLRYVVQVLGETVLLDAACADAGRLGWPAGAQATPEAAHVAAAVPLTELAAGESLTVPVVAETLVPVTRWQEAGAVVYPQADVRTTNQELDVPLRYEEAALERVALNRTLAEGEVPAPRQEGDTLVVPVVREEVVVMKRRVLVEEVRITRQVRTTTRHIVEPVQVEEVEITHPGLEAAHRISRWPLRNYKRLLKYAVIRHTHSKETI